MNKFKEALAVALRMARRLVSKVLLAPLKKVILIVGIVAIVIVAVVGCFDALMEAFSDKVSEHVQNNPVEYDIEDNSIIISDELIEELIKMMDDSGVDIETLKLTKEDIAKMYAAEVVTSEVNRGATEVDGKYYGRVYVKRATDSTEQLEDMTYTTLEDLQSKVQSFNGGNIGEEELLKFFAINDDKICFVKSITVETAEDGTQTRSAIIEELTYKEKISQFTMPIEFLMDLCLISQNPGFVLALADRVIQETRINIALLQTTTTTENTTTYKYQTETITSTKHENYDENGEYVDTDILDPIITVSPSSTEYTTETSTSTVTTTNTELKITSIESWFADYTYSYTKVPKTTNTTIPEDDPSNQLEEEQQNSQFRDEEYQYIDTTNHSDGSYTENYEAQHTRKINQSQRVDITTNSEIYQEGPTQEPVEKTDEIIELLKTPFDVPGSLQKQAAIDKLENGSGILFNMLKNGERTQTLEQLMRYILGKATNNNYGVSEFDFDQFNPSNFTPLSDYYGTGFWWPIGGAEIEIVDGKEFAKGDPTATNITSPFGNREKPTAGASSYHQAIDIGNGGHGSNYNNIIASADGVVTRVRDGQADGVQSPAEGNFVEIDHGNGIKTIYKHLYIGSIKVAVGDNVKQGQVIAKMGNSGASTAAHLHFEIRVNGTAVDPEEYVSAENPRPVGGSASGFSLNSTTFSQEEFKAKMLEYANKTGNSNFKTNFADHADEIYTASLSAGVNPELVVVTAGCETGWKKNSHNNYWGIGIPNGGSWSDGPYFATLTDGINRYASVIASYQPGGSQASMIKQRYEERKADNCNPNGYGMPGTFAGMQSVYSDLGGTPNIHKEGNSSDGGNYYLKVIYGDQFDEKCGNVHKIGVDPYTNQERADYTAWQCQEKVELRYAIFGI